MESFQHPDLLGCGSSCLVKMLWDKWASHSLSHCKPPHKKSFPLPSWPWTPAKHTLHITHKTAATDFTAASRMFSHFNRMVSTAVVVKSKVQPPTARSFWLEPQLTENDQCLFTIGHWTLILASSLVGQVSLKQALTFHSQVGGGIISNVTGCGRVEVALVEAKFC